MIEAMIARNRATWRAVAAAVVPELEYADEAAWRDVEVTSAHALASRPPALRRQFGLLLRVLAVLGRLRFGHALCDVDRARREHFLLALQRGPVPLLRRGVWGLRTIVLLGYYTRPQVMQAVGYRAGARGWAARREPPSTRPVEAAGAQDEPA